MGDVHEALVRKFRASGHFRGLKDAKSPMPDFRPDVFGEKRSTTGRLLVQVAVEVEIERTLYSEHTQHQIELLDSYVFQQIKKGIDARAYLVLPTGSNTKIEAEMLLGSLFPDGTRIRLLQYTK